MPAKGQELCVGVVMGGVGNSDGGSGTAIGLLNTWNNNIMNNFVSHGI